MMSDTNDALIEAATRCFAENAEMKLAAARLLDSKVTENPPAARAAIARWDKVDAKRRRLSGRMFLLLMLVVVSAMICAVSYRDVNDLRRLYSGPAGKIPDKKGLTAEQKLLLHGDATKRGAKAWKSVWDAHPDNPAYYAQYIGYYLAENNDLPADFLDVAKRIAPQNAWFPYLCACVEAEHAVQKHEAPRKKEELRTWDILDEAKFNTALRLIREGNALANYDDYRAQMLREKIPLLDQGTYEGRIVAMMYVYSIPTSYAKFNRLGPVIAAKADLLKNSKDSKDLLDLIHDVDLFVRKTTEGERGTVLAPLISRSFAAVSAQHLADAAKDLKLTKEANKQENIYQRIKEQKELFDQKNLLVEGGKIERKSNFLTGISLRALGRMTLTPPTITDSDLKPGRLLEHEFISIGSALAVYLLIGISLTFTAAFRFRQGPLMARLAKRMESLLGISDWGWLVGLGVLMPLAITVVINRLTPLGARDLSVTSLRFILPSGHFSGLFLLLLVMPILIARWRLGVRAAAFGFRMKKAWIGWAVAGGLLAYQVLIGLGARSDSREILITAVALEGIAVLWLLGVAARAFPQRRLLYSSTVARALVPVYATAMLVMIATVPVFQAAKQYWFAQDTFMVLDPARPSTSPYEYEVANQMQKELRELLGYDR